MSLHMASAPAVRRAVKTELSYRNDTRTILDFFVAADKNKDNANVKLAFSNS